MYSLGFTLVRSGSNSLTYLVKPQFKTNSNKEKLIADLKYITVQQFSKKMTLLLLLQSHYYFRR